MKFICDRCKTRYSIGDERVRGKILKIRCKNCANVITVREGMPEPEPSVMQPLPGPDGSVRKSSTTTVPANAISDSPAPPPPKAAAPAALEEEWYVSIDGDQSGPFSLGDAQAWVAEKPLDAELFCWSEGFDDWLPVDKVSHFRGLRKKSAAAPPRAPTRVPPPPPAPSEPEPKPLFAATMASLEGGASESRAAERNLGLSPLRVTPPAGLPAQSATPSTMGIASAAPAAPMPTIGSGPARANGAPLKAVIPPKPESGPIPKLGTGKSGPMRAQRSFDASEAPPAEPPHEGPPVAPPALAAGVAPSDPFAAFAKEPPAPPPPDDEDDGLSIGEVSRVVNLADLMKGRTSKSDRTGPVARGNGTVPRIAPSALRNTGAVQRLSATEAGLGTADALGPDGLPAAVEPPPAFEADVAAAQAAQAAQARSHRRAMLMLLGGVGVLLAAVIVLVVIVLSRPDDSSGTFGHSTSIDTTRPDEHAHPVRPDEPAGSDTPGPFVKPHHPTGPVAVPTPPPHVDTPVDPRLDPNALKPEEVEAMAAERSSMTQRCYMRSQKGADAILVGDVKRLSVTLVVDKTGAVTDVTLSDHATDVLGKCLVGAIKTWKFRTSPAGITAKITMVFASD
ncbi:MAG TPA: GYF domain-containing protein [Kofleriaceae bacterium]